MPPRKKNVVSDDRKKSMKVYNQNLTDEIKVQYKMNKILAELASGKQKYVRQGTIDKYTWGDQLPYIKSKLLPSLAQRRNQMRLVVENQPSDDEDPLFDNDDYNETEPEPPRDQFDYEKDLHCSVIEEVANNRPNITKTTQTNNLSKIRVLCRVSKTKDFRKILDDTPEELYKKHKEYIIPPNIRNAGKPYSPSTIKKNLDIILSLYAEYPPIKSYIENKTNHEDYKKRLEIISTEQKDLGESALIDMEDLAPTNKEDLMKELYALYGLETKLKKDMNRNVTANNRYMVALMYSYGIFKDDIDYQKVAYVPRLSLDNIVIDNYPTFKHKGDGKFYHRASGRLYMKGRDAHKTGGKYSYDHKVAKYVKDQIEKSLTKFPREHLLNYTSSTIGRELSSLMETHMSIPKFNNTRARKVYETILKAIGISSSQRSKALAHSPSVAKVNYIKTLVKNFIDQDKTEIIGFFKKLKTGK